MCRNRLLSGREPEFEKKLTGNFLAGRVPSRAAKLDRYR